MSQISEIVGVLKTIRVQAVSTEMQIHEAIAQALTRRRIHFRHEYRLISHKQFDFWVTGIVIEVKKKKPSKIALLNQLNRYTKVPAVNGIVVVMQESMHLPQSLNGKPIVCLSLNANWGLAF